MELFLKKDCRLSYVDLWLREIRFNASNVTSCRHAVDTRAALAKPGVGRRGEAFVALLLHKEIRKLFLFIDVASS